MLTHHFGNRRRQGRLAVIDVPDGSDIYVRFASVKLLFTHFLNSTKLFDFRYKI
jgi:hypothetical protein